MGIAAYISAVMQIEAQGGLGVVKRTRRTPTLAMANGIIAGVFTIVGVVLGVLLEPVKAAFLNRARVRQERADCCAALLDAVTSPAPGSSP